MYKYEINLPKGSKKLELPKNSKIMIFAATFVTENLEDINMITSLYDNFQNNKPFQLRK